MLALILLYVLISSGGWVLIGFGVRQIKKLYQRLDAAKLHCTGRVVDIIRHTYRDGGYRKTITTCNPVVEFTVDGREYRLKNDSSFPDGKVKIGDVLEVLCDPDDPSLFLLEKKAKTDIGTWKWVICVGAIWLLLSLFLTYHIAGGQ